MLIQVCWTQYRVFFFSRVDRNQLDFGKKLQAKFFDAVRHNCRQFLEEHPAPKRQKNKSPSQAVYISYARGNKGDSSANSENEIVKRIEESLISYDYDVRRDTTGIPYAALISSFMKEIGRGRCVIVVINDKYLRSPYCMYELLEVYNNKRFHERVCPIVIEDVRVSSIPDQFVYVEYWSSQVQQLKEVIQKTDPANLATETLVEFFKFRDIAQNAAKLLKFLADMQHLTLYLLEKNEFAILRERIDQCLN